MQDSNRSQRRTKWWHWPTRFLLILIPLEIILPFVPVPGEYEAGIFYANSYRERIFLSKHSGRTDYNSKGYRDIEWPLTTQKQRIAFMGDSRVFGHYVRSHQTFSTYIRHNSSYDTMNFGFPGASIYEASDFIVDDVISYKPQIAVMCYDINSSLYSIVKRNQSGSRHNVALNLIRTLLSYRWLERFFYQITQGTQPVLELDEYDMLLKKSINRLQEQNIEVILLIGWAFLDDVPGLFTNDRYREFQKSTIEIGRQNKLKVIEMTKVLQGQKNMDQLLVGFERMHLSESGHQFAGKHILRVLSE